MDERPDEPQLPAPPSGLSQGPMYRRPAREPSAQTSRAGIFTLVGGILVVVSVFLPWFRVSVPGASATISEFRAGAWGLLILGGFAIARGLSMARVTGIHFGLGSPLIGGILMVVLLVFRWNDIQDAIRRYDAMPSATASVGIGFWGAALGAALVLVGGVLSMRQRR